MQSWIKNLHTESYGPADAEPVVLLHGWGSSTALMRPLAFALQDRYRVLNVDLPGHGSTPPPPAPWGVPEHAALVQALVDREIGQPAHFIGHSNGGRIALYMAGDSEYTAGIRTLSLISPSGIKARRTIRYNLKKGLATTLKAPFNLLPPGPQAYGLDWLRNTWMWQLLGSSDYSRLQGVMREVFVKTVNCYLEDRLQNIEAPTLLFWGTRDDAVSKYQMDILSASIPNSRLVTLEGASHYGYLDQPETVVRELRDFLSHHPIGQTAIAD